MWPNIKSAAGSNGVGESWRLSGGQEDRGQHSGAPLESIGTSMVEAVGGNTGGEEGAAILVKGEIMREGLGGNVMNKY